MLENRERLAALLRADPVLPTLRRILAEPAALSEAESGEPTRGCLVGNTTAELVPGDEQARALVAVAYHGFVDDVAAALDRAQRSGEVSRSASPRAQAQLLLLLFQGSALVGRVERGSRESFIDGIDAAIDALRAS